MRTLNWVSILGNYVGRKLKFFNLGAISGEFLEVLEVLRPNQQGLQSKIGKSETTISEMGDVLRNTLLQVANAISCRSGAQNKTENYAKSIFSI